MAGAGRPGLSPPLLFLLVLPVPPAAAALRLLLGAAPPFTCSQPVSAGEGSWGAPGRLGPGECGAAGARPERRSAGAASPGPGLSCAGLCGLPLPACGEGRGRRAGETAFRM